MQGTYMTERNKENKGEQGTNESNICRSLSYSEWSKLMYMIHDEVDC